MQYPRYYKLGQSHRLSSKEISQMKKLKKKGWTNLRLSTKFGISPAGVRYHVNPVAHEYYLKRLREKTKKESQSDKNLRNKKAYYRKMELFKREWLDYLNNKHKNSASYPHGYKAYYKKYKKILDQKDMRILEKYFKEIRPKLKQYAKQY